MIRRAGEEGAALLAVLMLVAVLGALAAVALDRTRLATRLAANGAAAEQARAYIIGAEAIALAQAARLSDPVVAQAAAAAEVRTIRLSVPGGTVTARLSDGADCFNLNSVAAGAQADRLTARPIGIAQFSALMQVLGVLPRDADAVATATADWIDADTAPLPGGAEDDAYARLAPPYRTANRPMADASELRAVAGVTPALYALLAPYLCALPEAALSPLNVDALPPERAALVAMLIPGALPIATARGLLESRPAGGWGDASLFWKGPALGGLTPLAEVQAQAEVRLRRVRALLDVAIGGAELRETVLIDVSGDMPRIVQRVWDDAG